MKLTSLYTTGLLALSLISACDSKEESNGSRVESAVKTKIDSQTHKQRIINARREYLKERTTYIPGDHYSIPIDLQEPVYERVEEAKRKRLLEKAGLIVSRLGTENVFTKEDLQIEYSPPNNLQISFKGKEVFNTTDGRMFSREIPENSVAVMTYKPGSWETILQTEYDKLIHTNTGIYNGRRADIIKRYGLEKYVEKNK